MLSHPDPHGLELNISLPARQSPVNHSRRDDPDFNSNLGQALLVHDLRLQSFELTKPFSLSWVRQQDQLREIQAFRAHVARHHLNESMISAKVTNSNGLFNPNVLAQDLFDEYCEHILVKNSLTGDVLASCRLLTPAQAKRVGGLELEHDFDLTRIRAWRSKVLELGRVCIHPRLKISTQRRIFRLMQEQILGFVQSNQLLMVVCAVHEPIAHDLSQEFSAVLDRPALMSSTRLDWQFIRLHHLSPFEFQLRARYPLMALKQETSLVNEAISGQASISSSGAIVQTSLSQKMSSYLRMGAKVMGQPSWSREHSAVHWALMMRTQDLSSVLPSSSRN